MSGDERAVSEVLGYVLIFALVTATVGIVFTVGVADLEAAQQAEQVNNVERAFDVLAHNFEDMHRRESPSRATEIRLIGGTLEVQNSVNVSVVTNDSNATIYPTQVSYVSDGGTEIVYVAGAVFRTDDNSTVMLREPDFLIDDEHTVLTVVRTIRSTDSARQIEGERIALIVGTYRGGSIWLDDDDPGSDVTVYVNETPRADAWERYFESMDGGDVDRTGDSVEYTFDTKRITFIRSRISVELVG